MQGRRTTTIIIEAASIALLTGVVNLFFTDQPGFPHLYYTPYFLGSLLIAAVYGAGAGVLSLVFSCAVVAGALPLALALIYDRALLNGYWHNLLRSASIPGPIALLFIYFIGVMRNASLSTEKKLKKRIEKLSKENWQLRQESDSLLTVNRELDERVSRQRESITSLYTQLQKLDTLDTNHALDALLETIQIFSGATRVSVWKYEERTDQLVLAANRGWVDSEEATTSLPLEGTIEGWVFRNNRSFSVRMTLQYDNLKKMDTGRNLITLPLSLQRKGWGVVNIGDMPFEKYSLYTERLLHIIIALAEHSIEEAVSHESIFRKEETDEDTGLPLFSQFYRMLEEETRRSGVRKGDFSVVLIDFTNYGDIVRDFSHREGKKLIGSIAAEIESLSEHRAHLFHYREESQLAIIYPNLDSDGVSLFCLETLEKINQDSWQVQDTPVNLEAVIGFSVFSGEKQSAEEVLEQAERLLEMQKL